MILGEIRLQDTPSSSAIAARQSPHSATGWLPFAFELARRRNSLLALVFGELTAGLLALVLAGMIASGSQDWTAVAPLDLPIWLSSCVICGLYRRSNSEPYERLRNRVFAVSLFTSIKAISDILSKNPTAGFP